MKKYLIEWFSVDTVATAKVFLEYGHGLDESIKVHQSCHILGQPRGLYIVETDKPELIQQAIVHWGPSLKCTVSVFLTDAEALEALKLVA